MQQETEHKPLESRYDQVFAVAFGDSVTVKNNEDVLFDKIYLEAGLVRLRVDDNVDQAVRADE